MTATTPGSSSPGPNTVIGARPAGLNLDQAVTDMVRGHAAIVEAITEHAQHRQLLHSMDREQQAGGDVPRG